MTRKTKTAETRANTGETLTPPPPPSRSRLHLNNTDDIRREFASLYRSAKFGEIEPAAAAKLGYLLTGLARVYADHVLEERMAAIERELAERKEKNA